MKVSVLDGPSPEALEKRQQLAELFAAGSTRADIADTFGISMDTVSDWRKRQDIQALTDKIIRDRANRVLSLTDSKIEKALEQTGNKWSIERLLAVRREFAGSTSTIKVENAQVAKAVADLMEQLANNPDAAAALAAADDNTGN